ncbi:transposase family protein [Lachnoanaerobaculum saburreum]|uniref:transposase family protein n=1 Tax=Lachnoanaerobaculum saburreum TaxID=467210 RepID=UPI0009D6C930
MRLYFFAKIRRDKFENEEYLKRYIKLENGIPSHDTLCRVFGMLQPEILQQIYKKWQE